MQNNTVVPQPPEILTGQIINGRLIGQYHRIDRYWKWDWSCVIHETKSLNPMRIKDIKNKKGPFCCYDRNGKNNPTWQGHEQISMTYFNQVKNGAILRGHAFEISFEDMWRQWTEQDGRCNYSNRKLVLGKDASLDRINSNVGYISSNVQWLHKDVNMAKQRSSEKDFLAMCKEIADFSAGRI